MRSPLRLSGFASRLPLYGRPQEEGMQWLAAAHARAAATAGGEESDLASLTERMSRLVKRYGCPSSQIGFRRSDLSDFMHTDWPQMRVFNLHECPRGRGLEVRNLIFEENADRVVRCLFSSDSEPPSEILHVSCTGYASPSAIQRLIEQKQWHRRTRATQVCHMGCYAAVPALRLACALLGDGGGAKGRRAEIVHTESCTLHFDPGNHSPEQVVIQSLFADGHIRYGVSAENGTSIGGRESGFEILSVGEEIVPDSLGDMTWVLSDWGFRMTLSRDVPGRVAAAVPEFLDRLFAGGGLRFESDAAAALFAIHPGGPRILDSIRETLGLAESQVAPSRAVLFARGNMSSATLPHIWMALSSDAAIPSGALVVSLAFGPGLTIAGALFTKC